MASYEEARQRRIEENKKRMLELNLNVLSRALKPTKPQQKRPPRPKRQTEQPRRSIRIANRPAPSYTTDGIHTPKDDRVMERAKKLQESLDSEYPSFVKSMVAASVSVGSQLVVPIQFSKDHLPSSNATIALFDEEGDKFSVRYVLNGHRLSHGWKEFSVDHELEEGDVLVFHMIKPRAFEVHIIRAKESEEKEDDGEDEDGEEEKQDEGVDEDGEEEKQDDGIDEDGEEDEDSSED